MILKKIPEKNEKIPKLKAYPNLTASPPIWAVFVHLVGLVVTGLRESSQNDHIEEPPTSTSAIACRGSELHGTRLHPRQGLWGPQTWKGIES